MPVPATTGQLRTNISDMEIGDYIQIHSMGTGRAYGIGSGSKTELPVVGVANGSTAHNYFWYMVKVAKGLLVSDRVWFHTYTWDALNTGKLIQGSPVSIGSINGSMRSLAGGVAYADVNGNISLVDRGLGAWPTNNEWDSYIVNFPKDKIQIGKTLDDVFHWNGVRTWCQDTPIKNVVGSNVVTSVDSTYRMIRSHVSELSINVTTSNYTVSSLGFRPVFEYKEV